VYCLGLDFYLPLFSSFKFKGEKMEELDLNNILEADEIENLFQD